jgi:hypothetical protein
MIERYARLDDVKRFNAAQYLGLCCVLIPSPPI